MIFNLKTRTFSKKYKGNLEVGMFDSTADINGNPYVGVDYTGIESSYDIMLKSLALSSAELLAVAGINAAPVVYYLEPGSEKIELMRTTSVTVPIDILANGGDFSVSLGNISKTSQQTT